MISFKQAQRLIEKNVPCCRKKTVRIEKALGFVLAEDVHAAIDLPVGDNSAMDGFALRSRQTRRAHGERPVFFKIRGDIKAGDRRNHAVERRETYRIMTGALIPKGADTVIPKEVATVDGNQLIVDRFIPPGNHIRRKGEEVKKGRIVLRKGSPIHPATIGILAMLGKERVKVFDKPIVGLITTGDELVKPGIPLKPGQIYDSNSFMVKSALETMGICPLQMNRVKDNPQSLRRAVHQAFKQSDVIVLMGGISTGDYDYVKKIVEELGVRKVFWKVNQRPGKPLYFGRKGRKLVFGLPGNPASVFTCFYEYVFPALRILSGFHHPYLKRETVRLKSQVTSDRAKTVFLKAKMTENGRRKIVIPLHRQGSHMISSLQDANCFVLIPPSPKAVKEGQNVRADLLPLGNGVL